jgi:hypothetical protein
MKGLIMGILHKVLQRLGFAKQPDPRYPNPLTQLFYQEAAGMTRGRPRVVIETNSAALGAPAKRSRLLPGGLREVKYGHRGWEPINTERRSGVGNADFLRDGAVDRDGDE